MVLAEVENNLLNIYAKKYSEQENLTQKILSVNGSSCRSVLVRDEVNGKRFKILSQTY